MVALVLVLVSGLLLMGAPAAAQTIPALPRSGANLVPNPTANGATGWAPITGASYDSTKTRTADGSGSFKLPKGSELRTGTIAVTAGTTYTAAAYIFTAGPEPPGFFSFGFHYTYPDGAYKRYGGQAGDASNGTFNTWEEIVMQIIPDPGETNLYVTFYRVFADPPGAGDMWVDEAYMGVGLGFDSSPAAKVPFNGSQVRVDALGNITLNKGGTFQPFFPFCIYGDQSRPNFHQVYSNQGFNCENWLGNAVYLPGCKAAVSAFNPDGLMCGRQVAQFAWPAGADWNSSYTSLINEINGIKASPAADNFLWWYWDNENEWDEWSNPMGMLQTITDQDRTVVGSGTRMHPIFVLQGSYNAARSYHYTGQANLTNVLGTYADAGATGGSGHAGGFDVLQRLQNQTIPPAIVDANIVQAGAPVGTVRSYLYKFLGRGLKSWIMWRDCYVPCGDADPVDQAGWWPDIPNLRHELDALLPLIRTPHWTTWTVSHTGGVDLHVGTRDYTGAGHLILLNDTASPKTVTFTLSGLPYTPSQVRDYFTDAVVTTVAANQFTVTIPALGLNSGSKVLRLEGAVDAAAPTVTITTPACTPTCTTSSIPFTGLGGTATDTTGVPVGGITVACTPSCGTPTVTCPSCGPSATSVSWTVGGITIAADAVTTITVTATDATAKTGTATMQVTHTTPPPPATLALYWPLSENSGLSTADTSGTVPASPGQLFGPPTWTPGCVGAGLSFTGSLQTQYVRNATFPWPAGQAVSIALWVKVPGSTENGTFKFGSTDDRIGAHVPWSDNRIYFDHGHGTNGRVDANFAAYLNQWTHVVLVSNGTNYRAIYINGALANSSTTPTASIPALTGIDLGLYDVAPFNITYYSTGLLDEFRVYKGMLTASEITTLYNASAGCLLAPNAPPVVTVTTNSSTVTSSPQTVTGTATDDTGVVSLATSCSPSCGNPTVVCTPACGAAATSVSWSVSVALQAGANVITVQATDGVPQTHTQQRTLTLVAPLVSNTGISTLGMPPFLSR
jgi:hypothetical protein